VQTSLHMIGMVKGGEMDNSRKERNKRVEKREKRRDYCTVDVERHTWSMGQKSLLKGSDVTGVGNQLHRERKEVVVEKNPSAPNESGYTCLVRT